MAEQHWLIEQLKTVRSLAEISLILIDKDRLDLLPTVLELLHLETQQLIDENCIKGDEEWNYGAYSSNF